MKKLMPLMSLLLVTSLSFSQTVTKEVVKTDTIVPLTIPTAKLVIQDLVKGDAALVEIIELQKVIILTNEKLALKDTIISTMNSKISNLDYIIKQKEEQFKLERQKSDELLKELKSEKRKTFFYKLGTYAAGVVTVLYLTK